MSRRKALGRLLAAGGLALLGACAPAGFGGGDGPRLEPGAPVPVALLVPSGSSQASDNLVARQLENAARLAIADLSGVAVDLRVYPTGGDPGQAGAVAATAVAEGAAVILGPLYQEEAPPVGLAAAEAGVNVLAFTNNPTVAGGNVFVLGPTFRNTADRLVRYASGRGISRYLVAHGNDLGGTIGRDAIVAAANAGGATVAAVEVYPLSQQGIEQAAPRIAAAAASAGAQAVFTTADAASDLPYLATALAGAGLSPAATPLVGLTRWSAVPQVLSLPGLQGGLFALPDRTRSAAFEGRYRAAYGEDPLPVAAVAYDGIAAIGALAARGGANPLGRGALTQGQGFQGTTGIFRFNRDGTSTRGLAVATVENSQVVILDPAPQSFGGAGL